MHLADSTHTNSSAIRRAVSVNRCDENRGCAPKIDRQMCILHVWEGVYEPQLHDVNSTSLDHGLLCMSATHQLCPLGYMGQEVCLLWGLEVTLLVASSEEITVRSGGDTCLTFEPTGCV